jgi:ankyrin repeat protein
LADRYGITTLHLALSNGHLDIAKLFNEHGTPRADNNPNPSPPVRRTPASAALSDPFRSVTPDASLSVHPSVCPSALPLELSRTSAHSCWHALCDQVRDHCRYLWTCATG